MSDSPSSPDTPDQTIRYEPAATPSPEPPQPSAPVVPPPPPSPPTWQRTGGDSGHTGAIVFGVILVAIGLWFFADQTLGLEMPNLRWSELWPLIIIALGGWIVLTSLRRSR